jgi:cytochrome c-type biogenesis protein CcmH
LVRSYKVLGETGKMQTAIADARRALAGDSGKLQQLNAALKTLESEQAATAAATTPPAQKAAPGAPPQHDGEAIAGMVAQLAERLKKSGSNPDGWIMLTRSYLTLGEKDKATAAIASARAALAGDPAKLAQFNSALKQFKIDETAAAAPAMSAPAAAPAEAPAPDEQTDKMIRGMVTRLAERLKQDGSDVDGWMRLVRSYVVLGERDKAMGAVADARRAVGSDADKLRRLDDFIKTLGLNG